MQFYPGKKFSLNSFSRDKSDISLFNILLYFCSSIVTITLSNNFVMFLICPCPWDGPEELAEWGSRVRSKWDWSRGHQKRPCLGLSPLVLFSVGLLEGAFLRSCPLKRYLFLAKLTRICFLRCFLSLLYCGNSFNSFNGHEKNVFVFCASFLFLKTAFGDRPHNLRPDAATVAGALPFVLLLTQAFSEHQISNIQ